MIPHSSKSFPGWPPAVIWLAVLLSWMPVTTRAQSGIGDIIYTVGTTVRDANQQDWAYILWQGTQPGLVSNRVFAVYGKPGVATNLAPYTRLSLVAVQTDPRVIKPLLARAGNLGDNLAKLDQDLGALFGSFIPLNTVTVEEQLSAVISGSLGRADYYQFKCRKTAPRVTSICGFAGERRTICGAWGWFSLVTICTGWKAAMPPAGGGASSIRQRMRICWR